MSDFTEKIKHVDDIYTNYNVEIFKEELIKRIELNNEAKSLMVKLNWKPHDISVAQTPRSYFNITQGFQIKGKTYCIVGKKTVYSRDNFVDIHLAFVEVKVSETSVWNNLKRRSDNTTLFLRKKKPEIVFCHENQLINRLSKNEFNWVNCFNF